MSRRVLRIGLVVLLVGGLGLVWWSRDTLTPAAVVAWVEGLGVWGPLVFVGIYCLAPALFVPGAVLTLAGGALFGPLAGALLSLTGATVGATVAFLLARYLAADWVERRLGPRLQVIQAGVEREGWRFVAFVRLVPVFPFNLLNYALGLHTRWDPVFGVPNQAEVRVLGPMRGIASGSESCRGVFEGQRGSPLPSPKGDQGPEPA